MTQVCHNHVVVNPSVQTSYSFEDNHLTCHFNKANGILYQVQEERGIQAASPKPQQGLPDDNLTSIITDIDGFSIVLTGDSFGDVVTGKLDLTGKKVKIFQVPHHGSNKQQHTRILMNHLKPMSTLSQEVVMMDMTTQTLKSSRESYAPTQIEKQGA